MNAGCCLAGIPRRPAAEEHLRWLQALECHSVVNGFPAAGTGVGCLLKTNLADEVQRLHRAAVVLCSSQRQGLSSG